jgi:hypothetical protein
MTLVDDDVPVAGEQLIKGLVASEALLTPDTDENVIGLPAAARSNSPASARERAAIRWAT